MCHTMKTAHEQPKEFDKELKASIWPQIVPDPNLMSYTGRAVGMRVFTLSEMMFGWGLWVKERPHEHPHPQSRYQCRSRHQSAVSMFCPILR